VAFNGPKRIKLDVLILKEFTMSVFQMKNGKGFLTLKKALGE
jgi:hypothetical protein